MAARFTPEQLKKEAARIRERMRSGELAGPAAMQMLYDLNIDIRGDPIVTPEAQAEVERAAQERQQELQKKRDARLKKINEVMPPAPERFAPEQGQPYQSPIPSPEQVSFPPGAPQLPIPNGGMSGGAGPFQPSPPEQQGPPNPLEGLTGSISPQPPPPPAPGGGMSIGIRNPMDNLAAAEAAWPGMAPGGMGVQPPQPPQPPGPPNPFAGIGDAFGPDVSPQVAEALYGAQMLPGPAPGGMGPPPAGPPPPMGGYDPLSSIRSPGAPQAGPTSTLDVAKEAARQALRERDDMAARINRDELGADPGGFTAAAAERSRQMQQSAAPVLDPAREAARRTLQLHPDTGRIRTAPGLTQFNQPAVTPPAPGLAPLIRPDLTTAAAAAGGRSLTPLPVSRTGIFAPGLPRPRPTNSREEQAVRQTALGVPLPGDLIAGSASPVEAMGSDLPIGSERTPYRLEGGYYPGLTKDDYIGSDEEDKDEETSAGLSAADLAGRGLAVAETTSTYSGDGSDSSGVSPPPGIPPPEPAAPLVELQPLIREERYVLPESSRNSQAFFGFGNNDRPVKHVQLGNEWEDPEYKFQKFGEPRTGSRLGAWLGGAAGFLAGAYTPGSGLVGTGLSTYTGQKLGRKVGGWLGDRETGAFSRFTNPDFARDIAQERADAEANRLAKKGVYLPVAGARGAPIHVIEERDLPPLIAEDNPNAILMANEGRQIAEAVKSNSIARESMAREGGGTRTGGLFGSGYGSGNYGYSGNYPGWGGYGGGYGPDSIGGAYRNR